MSDIFGFGAMAAGGMNLAGTLATNATNYMMHSQDMSYNAAEAATARAFNSAEAVKGRQFAADQAQLANQFTAQQAAEARANNWDILTTQNRFASEMQQGAQAFNAGEAVKARAFEQAGQERAMGFNASQAQLDREFQQMMSNSSYQRAMADMRAAGLNPVLAYQQGGASSPSGANASVGAIGGPMASSPGGSVPGGAPSPYGVGHAGSSSSASGVPAHIGAAPLMQNAIADAFHSALKYAEKGPTVENLKSTNRVIEAEADLKDQQRSESAARTELFNNESIFKTWQTALTRGAFKIQEPEVLKAGNRVDYYGGGVQAGATRIGDFFKALNLGSIVPFVNSGSDLYKWETR